MRDLYIKSKVGTLPIGRRGENLVARVIYPGVPEEGQVITVFIKRNGDTAAYPASNTEVTDTEVIWTITSVDTDKQGYGQVQYRYTNAETGEVLKTDIFSFFVGMAIDTEVGPVPDPYETWLDSLTDLAGQAQVAAREAETSAISASQSAMAAHTSENNAGQSATAASASATSASQSAQTATTKASEAAASATTATTKASEASASATAAQEAQTGAETAQAGAESAAETAQAGADAVGLLKEQIYNSYPNVEAETGPIVSITDGADGIPVKSLVVGIEPVQAGSGDPSPDNIRPITGWTGAIISHSGADVSNPETIPITFPSEAGTVYGGSLDVTSGVLTVDRAGYTFNGTEDYWKKSSTYRGSFYRAWSIMPAGAGVVQGAFTCSHAGYVSNFSEYAYGKCGSDSALNLWLMQDPDATIDDLKAFLAEQYANGTPVTVCYTLATPITYTLTPTEVITTLLGSNNVWADTGDTSLAYRADTKLYIDRLYGMPLRPAVSLEQAE